MSDPGFYLLANRLCLDFVNTLAASQGEPVDFLAGYGDLLAWLRAAGVLDEAAAKRAKATGAEDEVFRRAFELRAALHRMAERLVAGDGVGDESVEAVDAVLAECPRRRRLARHGDGFALSEEAAGDGAVGLLAPVAGSAAELLAGDDLALVRRCANPDCVLFFYDVSKNRRRRWCSMEGCGARAKSAAYYRRRRAYTGRP